MSEKSRSERNRMTVDTSGRLSEEKAHILAQDVQRWCRERWLVMWEPYHQVFTAYPMYDFATNTPVEADGPRTLRRAILDVDQELLNTTVEAIPAHPPRVIHISAGFLLEALG